jgi:uncharacterized protein
MKYKDVFKSKYLNYYRLPKLEPCGCYFWCPPSWKTTLAKTFAKTPESGVYLDLDNLTAQAQLRNPSAFFEANRHRLVILDEIQNQPEIVHQLRGEIDADRRPGRFLLLGSASFKLLKQSQSLAGRLSLVDMSPLLLSEVFTQFSDIQTIWLRGGFPNSYMSKLGINVEPQLMHRYWRMLAHLQGQLFNASILASSLGISATSSGRYLDYLCDSLMVRRLEPHFVNLGKRLANHLPQGALMSFYRTAAGTEMDVVEVGQRKIGFEVKFSSAPTVTKGF